MTNRVCVFYYYTSFFFSLVKFCTHCCCAAGLSQLLRVTFHSLRVRHRLLYSVVCCTVDMGLCVWSVRLVCATQPISVSTCVVCLCLGVAWRRTCSQWRHEVVKNSPPFIRLCCNYYSEPSNNYYTTNHYITLLLLLQLLLQLLQRAIKQLLHD